MRSTFSKPLIVFKLAVAVMVLAPSLAQGQTPAPLSTFKDCEQCPEMVALSADFFMMGAGKDDRKLADRYTLATESPRHKVVFDYSFAIGKYEVTVDEFAAYVEESGARTEGECELRLPDRGPGRRKFIGTLKPGVKFGKYDLPIIIDGSFRRPGREVGGRHPATCISRRQAKAYLAWLSKKSGRKYRFPTEAEWEYAVRAGTTTAFHYGNKRSALCKYGNFADRKSPYVARVSAKCAEKPSVEVTAPVGRFAPNGWGLYDMIGNVFEFVEDCHFDNYRGAPSDGSPRMKAGTCASFATRGYFFDSLDVTLRSAARCYGTDWDSRSNGLGIRVVVSLDGSAWDLE